MNKKKISKKTIIIAGVSVAAVIVAVVVVVAVANSLKNTLQSTFTNQTAIVTKRDLKTNITATGTIESFKNEEVSAAVAGIKIDTVSVSVGDSVKKGDILATLNSKDLEDKITDLNEQIAVSAASDSITQKGLNREQTYSAVTQTEALQKADRNIADAQENVTKLEAEKKTADTDLSNARKDRDGKKSIADSAYTNIAAMKKTYDDLVAALEEIDPGDTMAIENAQAAAEKAKITWETAKGQHDSAVAAYNAAAQTVSGLETKVNNLVETVKNAKKSYDLAVADKASTELSISNSAASQKENYDKTKLTLGEQTSQLKTQLNTYKEQLEDCTIRAPFDGIVTAVNAKEGAVYQAGAMFKLENCEDFKVTTQIAEYDISNIALGMGVLIKTDATGDEELEGEITFISPIASVGSEVSYEVKIDVKTMSDRLRLGMSAKLSITLEEKKDVLAVPYNAIYTDEVGQYILLKSNNGTKAPSAPRGQGGEVPDDAQIIGGADGETSVAVSGEQTANAGGAVSVPSGEKIYVTVGMDSEYYVEISGAGVKEGMEVILPESAIDTSNVLNMMGNGGGRAVRAEVRE